MRVGHTPLWGDRATAATGWRRVLWWPFLLWEVMFYRTRVNITTRKTRPEDWAKLQGERRFFDALFCYLGPPSHFLWNIKWPLALVMAVSFGMCAYEYARLELGWHVRNLDRGNVLIDSFRLASFAMALLLSYRVGKNLDRWWAARSGFAGVGSACVALAEQAAAWVDDERLKTEIRNWAVVWHYSVLQVVQGEKALRPQAAALLSAEELQLYSSSRKGRQLVVNQLRLLVREAAPASLQSSMESTLAKGWADADGCVQLYFQALPAGLTLVTTGFMLIWLTLLPFGLWEGKYASWFGLIGIFFVAVLLVGTDEIATQLENPFPLLPLEEIVASTVRDSQRALVEAAELRALRRQVRAREAAANGAFEAANGARDHVAVGVAPGEQ